MTVCIAAICGWKMGEVESAAVITASDRMITRRGDFEYEPPQPKFLGLTTQTSVLFAGDITVHSEAIQKSREALKNPIDDVGEIAEVYASFVRAFREREAAQTYLSPLGLTRDDLLSSNDSKVADQLREQIQNHSLSAEALIVGADKIGRGAHIYHVDGRGFVTCHDEVGFVAIGIGAPHAESQIMAFKYAPWWRYFNTVVMLYSAKKRAEVAPGVGPETDMNFITLQGVEPLRADILKLVSEQYEETSASEQALRDKQAEFLLEKFRAAQGDKAATSTTDNT